MTAGPNFTPSMPASGPVAGPPVWREVAEVVFGIAGAIALFLGLFILFGGEDQYLGISGELSWRVGDITAAWGYWFLVGGAGALVGVLASVMARRRT